MKLNKKKFSKFLILLCAILSLNLLAACMGEDNAIVVTGAKDASLSVSGTVGSANAPALKAPSYAINFASGYSISVADEITGAAIMGATASFTGANSFTASVPLSNEGKYAVITIKDAAGRPIYKKFLGRIPLQSGGAMTLSDIKIDADSTARAVMLLEDETKAPKIAIATASNGGTNCEDSLREVITDLDMQAAELSKAIDAIVSVLLSPEVPESVKNKILTDVLNGVAELLTVFVKIAESSNDIQKAGITVTPSIIVGKNIIDSSSDQTMIGAAVTQVKANMLEPVSPVLFYPGTGNYASEQSVKLTCDTPGVTIKYTIDGSEPMVVHGIDIASGGSIPVNKTTTIKAIAVRKGMNRPIVTSATYTFNYTTSAAALPEITIDLGGGVMLEMVKIPAGTFQMGQNGVADPPHKVTISKDFYIAKYEMTQRQISEGADVRYGSGFGVGDNYPEYDISWNNICQPGGFIDRINAKTGKKFRLPTEAEWEYAARGGTQTPYCWGNDSIYSLDFYAWYASNAFVSSHPVGEKLPNAYGLYDMIGNVQEWCSDWSAGYSPDAVTDPSGPATGTQRVLRGGYWNTGAYGCFSAARGGDEPSVHAVDYGFRLAMSADGSAITETAATPALDPGPGSYVSSQPIVISCATPGVTLKYTTDGSIPSPTNNGITMAAGGSVTISKTTTINVIAFKTGMTSSAVVKAAYTINDSTITPATAIFNKKPSEQADVVINLTLNGNTFKAIRNAGSALIANTDYSVSGNIVTIKRSYLSKVAAGPATLTFVFSAGNDRDLSLMIADTTPGAPVITIDLGGGVMLEMVKIPAGTFQMGQNGVADPPHKVTISKDFYIAKYEMTQRQISEGADVRYGSGFGVGDNYPEYDISWNNICQPGGFIDRINAKTGKKFRLPTEAEWEYAARGGTQTPYCWGNDSIYSLDFYAWYASNAFVSSHPVGEKLPNAYGLYDMIGNVQEWCSDWSAGYSPDAVTDPSGPVEGTQRVIRGGYWNTGAYGCFSAVRGGDEPGVYAIDYGFRLAMSADQSGLTGKLETPVFSPASGTYNIAQKVTITCPTAGTEIYYTTDGAAPDASKTKYTGAISVIDTTTIKAVAIKAGLADSDKASASYTINPEPLIIVDLGGGVKLEMVKIPAGKFRMGQPGISEPVHGVTISRYFYIGKTELTQGQWKAVMNGANPSSFKISDSYPLEQASWNDICLAGGFLEKINATTGRTFRLPTAAEWEYAARGGTQTIFYWGDDPSYSLIGNYAWYKNNSASTTHPVGQKTPNAYGLYDMAGNVRELCGDYYGGFSFVDLTDPTGPEAGSYRVARGGAWNVTADQCKSVSMGGGIIPKTGSSSVGFRLVLPAGK